MLIEILFAVGTFTFFWVCIRIVQECEILLETVIDKKKKKKTK